MGGCGCQDLRPTFVVHDQVFGVICSMLVTSGLSVLDVRRWTQTSDRCVGHGSTVNLVLAGVGREWAVAHQAPESEKDVEH